MKNTGEVLLEEVPVGVAAPPEPDHERPAAAADDLQDLIRTEGERVDGVLAKMPQGLLEARNLILRELFDTLRADELHAIVGIAGASGPDDVLAQLPRRLLVLRRCHELVLVAGDRTVPDTAAGPEGPPLAARLLVELDSFDSDLKSALRDCGDEERKRLESFVKSIAPPRQDIRAAVTLGPLLKSLHEASRSESLGDTLPGIDDDTRAWVARTLREGSGVTTPAERACLNSVALRRLFRDILGRWNELQSPDEAGSTEATGAGEAELLAALGDAEIAYRVTSDQIQSHHNTALKRQLLDDAERLEAFRRALFSAYLELAPLRAGRARAGGPPPPGEPVAAPSEPASRKPYEDVIEEAVTDLGKGTSKGAKTRGGRRRRLRLRLAALVSTTLLLASAALLVHWKLPQGPPPPIEVSAVDFSEAIRLTEASPIGTMLYAAASSDWTAMEDRERISRVNMLGRMASERGFVVVYLVDPDGEPAAQWSAESGTALFRRNPAGS